MDATKSSGDIDYDFAAMIRIHHQGAVDMAEMALKKGKDPQMKQMAKEIIATQNKEIVQFDQWLAQHKIRRSTFPVSSCALIVAIVTLI